MKILVTGASGFIGGSIARRLAKEEHFSVVASGRTFTPENLKEENISYLQMDLNGPIPELDFDICIHAAGLADDNSTVDQLTLNNVTATQNLLNHLKGCKVFIFISSSSVYNFKKYPLAKEVDAKLEEELSAYGRSKLLAEKAVEASSIESIYILRPRAVYGQYDRTLLPRVEKRFRKGKIAVPGDLMVKSSLTNIENIIGVVKAVIDEGKKGVSVYNVADDQNYMLRTVFEKIGLRKYPEVKIKRLPIGLIRSIVGFLKFLRIPVSLSQQSIDYLTIDSRIDISNVKKNLNVSLEHNFDHFIRSKD